MSKNRNPGRGGWHWGNIHRREHRIKKKQETGATAMWNQLGPPLGKELDPKTRKHSKSPEKGPGSQNISIIRGCGTAQAFEA